MRLLFMPSVIAASHGDAPCSSSGSQDVAAAEASGLWEMTLVELAMFNQHFTMAAMLIALGGRFAPGRTLEQLQQQQQRKQPWNADEVRLQVHMQLNRRLRAVTVDARHKPHPMQPASDANCLGVPTPASFQV
jgi:hypothetical protein